MLVLNIRLLQNAWTHINRVGWSPHLDHPTASSDLRQCSQSDNSEAAIDVLHTLNMW